MIKAYGKVVWQFYTQKVVNITKCLSHGNKTWELITTEVEQVIEVLIFMYLVSDV